VSLITLLILFIPLVSPKWLYPWFLCRYSFESCCKSFMLLGSIKWHISVSLTLVVCYANYYLGKFTLAYPSTLRISSSRCGYSRQAETRRNLSKLSRDIWGPCNSCLIPCPWNLGRIWLVDELFQISNFPWIMPVHPGVSQARIARCKVHFCIGISKRSHL
jgi:hypothetical protein